jgi:hypothetical protein
MPSKKTALKDVEAKFVSACQADLAALKALQAKYAEALQARGIDLSQKTPRKR